MSGSDLAPLSGKLVVALEQAVAAPFCSSRLADAGARVIKIERKGAGDFARAYDTAANGESSKGTDSRGVREAPDDSHTIRPMVQSLFGRTSRQKSTSSKGQKGNYSPRHRHRKWTHEGVDGLYVFA